MIDLSAVKSLSGLKKLIRGRGPSLKSDGEIRIADLLIPVTASETFGRNRQEAALQSCKPSSRLFKSHSM